MASSEAFTSLQRERAYTRSVPAERIKALGQYFTDPDVAEFMCAWACPGARTMLDPAAGNSVFLRFARAINPECRLFGYEIDPGMLDYFGNPASAEMKNEDYLLNGWDARYDAIVCNPPYNRFQAISNRAELLDSIRRHTGVGYSRYTNLYILFLIKSLFQLTERGRLAYIVPSEFLNSKYGTPVKKLMLDGRLLRAIIHFKNDGELFFNATTTCCILLIDREPKDAVDFYSLDAIDELRALSRGETRPGAHKAVKYEDLRAEEKWRGHLNQEAAARYRDLAPLSRFCTVSRGIATGANRFFCLSGDDLRRRDIDPRFVTPCICRSADVRPVVFRDGDFQRLADGGRTVFLLDVRSEPTGGLIDYLRQGEADGIDKKYLPAGRKPWYAMEQKPAAPIWVGSACRERMRFVRNLTRTRALTTFHAVYVKPPFEALTDVLFCYFLTPSAQALLRENRKELGNGLEKFQPNDLNTARMLDVTLLSDADRDRVLALYVRLFDEAPEAVVPELDRVFAGYM